MYIGTYVLFKKVLPREFDKKKKKNVSMPLYIIRFLKNFLILLFFLSYVLCKMLSTLHVHLIVIDNTTIIVKTYSIEYMHNV